MIEESLNCLIREDTSGEREVNNVSYIGEEYR